MLRLLTLLWVVSSTLIVLMVGLGRASARGDQLLYSTTSATFLVDIEHPLTARLALLPGDENLKAALSPDGSQIAFIARPNVLQPYSLFLADIEDMETAKALVPEATTFTQPTWSPDGKQIVFVGEINNRQQVIIVQPETGEWASLNHGGIDSPPLWSPDREWLMYLSYRDGSPILYGADLDCRTREGGCRFADEPLADKLFIGDWPPAWSPDGRTLALTVWVGNNTEIYLVEIACEPMRPNCLKNPRRLTDNDITDYGPIWSPDGQSIVYQSLANGVTDIYQLNVKTGNTEWLTNGGRFSRGVWSPDGTRIAFIVRETEQTAFHVFDMNSRQTRWLNIPRDIDPLTVAWRPHSD
jgi:Tol biopolymer transport system component